MEKKVYIVNLKDTIEEEKFREFSRFGKGENAMDDVKRSDFNIKNPSISIVFSGNITGGMINEISDKVNAFIAENDFEDDWNMEIWPVHQYDELETEIIINLPLLEVIPSDVTKFFEDNNIIWGEDAKGYLVFPSEILSSELSCSAANMLIHPHGNIVVHKVEKVSDGTCVWFGYSNGHGQLIDYYEDNLTDYIRLKKEALNELKDLAFAYENALEHDYANEECKEDYQGIAPHELARMIISRINKI